MGLAPVSIPARVRPAYDLNNYLSWFSCLSMIVGYRAAPSLMVILVTLLVNLTEVLVYRLQLKCNQRFCALDNSPPGSVT